MIRAVYGLLVACIAIGSGVATGQTVDLDRVIAIVNNEAITFSDYQIRLRQEALYGGSVDEAALSQVEPKVLEAMIEARLQAQVADARGITVSAQEVDNVIRAMAAQNDISVADLYASLETRGLTTKEFRAGIAQTQKIRKVIDTVVNARIAITDQEVDYHIQSHQDLYRTRESYELSHLFISVKDLDAEGIQRERENMVNIRAALEQQNITFAEAVTDFSDGDNVQEGGYLGWRQNDQLPEIFLAALRQTPVDAVTEVIESPNGLHLLKIHGKRGDQQIVTQNQVRHILLQPRRRNISDEETRFLIDKIVAALARGEEFAALARLHSDDEASAVAGGELGWLSPGDTASEVEQAVAELALNTVSEPIRSSYGWHIVEVTARRERDISQDLVRKSAYAEIFRRKSNTLFRAWSNRLRDDAYIEYTEDN